MNRLRSEITFGLALGLSLAVACGTEETDPGPSRTIEIERFCAELAAADCDRLAQCDALYPPVEKDACLVRQRDVICGAYVAEARRLVDLGQLRYDEAQAARCRDEIGGLDCTVGLERRLLDTAECGRVFEGQVVAGESCGASFACADGGVCSFGAAQCPGTCSLPLGNNEPCRASEPCNDENFCSVTAMRCRARVARGQTCELSLAGNSCASASFCDTTQPAMPVCAAVMGRNSACTLPYQCAEDLACINGRCSGGDEGDACNGSLDCIGGRVCEARRCTMPLSPGADCTSGTPCAEGLTCTSSAGAMLCAPRPGRNEMGCSAERPCYLSRCVNGSCVALADDGAACSTDGECLPGRSCATGVCAFDASCAF